MALTVNTADSYKLVDLPHDLPLRDATLKDVESDEVVLVVVYTKHDMMGSLKRSRIKFFLESLQKSGLTVDSVQSITNRAVVFVKITAPTDVLHKYAPSLGIPLHCENPYFQESDERDAYVKKFFTDANVLGLASRSFGNVKIIDITVSEKIQIMYQILKFAKYGFDDDDVGINRLLTQRTIQTVYPTHEKGHFDPNKGIITDLYLLKEIWATFRSTFRGQPTFLVQKYYGAEIGFYFAFLNHFAKMLVPASILGLLTLIFGAISMHTANNYKTTEVCTSKIVMCATCVYSTCNYTYLNYSCTISNFNHMIDNQTTVIYGILISIWSTISFEMWKRTQSSLAYQWNVYAAHVNTSVRPQYETTASLRKLSQVTGEWEPYEDTAIHLCHSFLSILAMAFMVAISVLGIVGVTLKYNEAALGVALTRSGTDPKASVNELGAKTTSSLISVILMIVFDYIYQRVAVWLVDFENPRTEQEYDNSYILKIYFLTFINSFGVAAYIAFFKRRFSYHPGHKSETFKVYDRCDPTGCAQHLFIHILVVLIVKCMVKDIVSSLMTYLRVLVRKYRNKRLNFKSLPDYEQEYYFKEMKRYDLLNEYKEMAIQYGYITFFSSAQPLAPLIVLLHTLVEIRNDAISMCTNYRRTIPICVNGIGAWMQVFMAMTHLGVVTNALVIAWTMTFIPTTIYTYSGTSKPYYESRFSVFKTSDYPNTSDVQSITSIANHPDTCRYPALRNPPDSPHKYMLSGAFWHELTWMMAFIIIFEHVVLAITSIIAYSIPDIPEAIQQMMEHENLKLVKENYKKIGEDTTEDGHLEY